MAERWRAAIQKAAADLTAARGKSLVVSGTNDVDVQLLVNAINAQLGNYGTTVGTGPAYNVKQGNSLSMAQLADDLKAGNVAAL